VLSKRFHRLCDPESGGLLARDAFLGMPELGALPLAAALLPRFERGRDGDAAGGGWLDFRGFGSALAFLGPRTADRSKIEGA